MKKTILSIITLLTISAGVNAQNVIIPDANFKAYLLGNASINTNGDTEIQVTEATAFTGAIDCSNLGIVSITGIESFINLTSLNCSENQITSIDISTISGLSSFYCSENELTYLDLSQNAALEYVNCEANFLESLNAANGSNNIVQVFSCQNNPSLSCVKIDPSYTPHSFWLKDPATSWDANCSVDCYVHIPDANFKSYLVGNASINTNGNNEIECSEAAAFAGTINVYNLSISDLTGIEAFINLTVLYCHSNSLIDIDVSNNTALTDLACNMNALTSLDVSNNTALTYLNCNLNAITALDVTNNVNLTFLDCNTNAITSLDLSNNVVLSDFNCNINGITSLDLTNNTALTQFTCNSNALSSLDISNNTSIVHLRCTDNNLTSLNVANGNNTNFTSFNAINNPNLTCIEVDNVAWSTANWGSVSYIPPGASFSTNCPAPCTVNIPDANFKAYLVGNAAINTNGNNEIECTEASAFTGLMNCSSLNISDLTGIEAFTGLTELNCSSNQLSSIDLSNNTQLDYLSCSINQLTNLDISQNTLLETLGCGGNQLSSLDFSNNMNLIDLHVYQNQFTDLDVSNLVNLTYLNCVQNSLSSLNVANGNNSNFTGLDASGNPNLTCIQVDDAAYSTANWTNIDATASFSTDCSGGLNLNENNGLLSGVEIYPNPTNDFLNIETSEEISAIRVVDLTGKTVQVYSPESKKLDVSAFKTGVYLLEVSTKYKKTIIRIIKK